MRTKQWQYHRLGPDLKTFYITGDYSPKKDESRVVAELVRDESDARIISAAPDLLEALKALRAVLREEGWVPKRGFSLVDIEFAIDKAEGRR